MRVLIVGDVHGQHHLLAERLRQAQADYRIAAAIQVGDFGFYQDWISQALLEGLRFPVPLHVIDGNHEDHQWLQRALAAGAEREWRAAMNLIYQPRPSVARLGSSTVGFLGGALHVDRPQKHNWLGGWPNYILRAQREEAAGLFNCYRPELIVTHSCPSRIGIGLATAAELQREVAEHITAAGFDAGPPDDCGERELSDLWRSLNYQPRAWVFGHFHRDHQTLVRGTQFVCVGCDLVSRHRQLVLWDTEEKRLLHCPADPSDGEFEAGIG